MGRRWASPFQEDVTVTFGVDCAFLQYIENTYGRNTVMFLTPLRFSMTSQNGVAHKTWKSQSNRPVQFVLVITGGAGLAVSVLVLNTGEETPSLFWVNPVTQNSYWVAGRR